MVLAVVMMFVTRKIVTTREILLQFNGSRSSSVAVFDHNDFLFSVAKHTVALDDDLFVAVTRTKSA